MLIALIASLMALAGPYEDGVAALKAKDGATARVHFEAAARTRPTSPAVWWQLGWANYLEHDWDGTRAAWLKVKELDDDFPTWDYWMRVVEARKALEEPLPPQPPVEETARGTGLTVAAAGDTMLGSDLRHGKWGLPPDDGVPIFADVRDIFRAADVAFLNIEGAMADDLPDRKCGPSSTSCYAFRMPTNLTKGLLDAGIDAASIANNHAFDLGAPGMQSSMDTLDAVGIAHTGPYGDVGYVTASNGMTVAFVGAHSGTCCLNVNDLDDVQRAVRKADTRADLVVLSFHGGAEGARHRHVPFKREIAWGERRGDVHALAHAAIDAGADLVLGHGPHVLRAMEVYKGRLVVYSMGNFVGYRQFGTKGGYGGHSVIVEAELAANGVLTRARLHPVKLDGEGVPHPDPDGVGLQHVRELTEADFPETGVRVGPDGALSWGPASKAQGGTSPGSRTKAQDRP